MNIHPFFPSRNWFYALVVQVLTTSAARTGASKSGKKSRQPTVAPSDVPTLLPSFTPSVSPSSVPSTSPSQQPTQAPSSTPSDIPTLLPSLTPSVPPSSVPSTAPSESFFTVIEPGTVLNPFTITGDSSIEGMPLMNGVPDFCGLTIVGDGVWYRVTGDGTYLIVATGNISFDTRISVFTSETQVVEDCVGGNDDLDLARDKSSSLIWKSKPALYSYIFVHGYGGATGSFELSLASSVDPPASLLES